MCTETAKIENDQSKVNQLSFELHDMRMYAEHQWGKYIIESRENNRHWHNLYFSIRIMCKTHIFLITDQIQFIFRNAPVAAHRWFYFSNSIAMKYFTGIIVQAVTVPAHMYCPEHIQIKSLIELHTSKKTIRKTTIINHDNDAKSNIGKNTLTLGTNVQFLRIF